MSRIILKSLLAALSPLCVRGGSHLADETLKIGAFFSDSAIDTNGKAAIKLWEDWVNKDSNNKDHYKVEIHHHNAKDELAKHIKEMTDGTTCKPACVDVIICPYTSGLSNQCVDAVHTGWTGPIMVWGGASGSIFTKAPKRHFGTLSEASMYTATGLELADSKEAGTAEVAIICNNNGFSRTVANGANATIHSHSGLHLQSWTDVSVAKNALTAADKTKVKAAMDKHPTMVVISGHNGDVEEIVVEIAKSGHTPHAILATNSITTVAKDHFKKHKHEDKMMCLMMPTQWAMDATMKDPVIGWTTKNFQDALGSKATYHAASAAAAGIAISNAMHKGEHGKRIGMLADLIAGLNIDSFYGKLHFNDHGINQKPMYTEQHKTGGNAIVAPTPPGVAASYPLSSCTGWKSSDTTDSTDGASGLRAAAGALAITFAAAFARQ